MTVLRAVWNMALRPKDVLQALSFRAQCCTESLKKDYDILTGLADPCENSKGYRAL